AADKRTRPWQIVRTSRFPPPGSEPSRALEEQSEMRNFHRPNERLALGLVVMLSIHLATLRASRAAPPRPTITVSGTPWGVSTCYLGATEGNVGFDVADLQGAGLSTYRIYGGMSRWEQVDDDGTYGSPDIASIKANPNVINWAWWDNAMTNPPGGTDYWW